MKQVATILKAKGIKVFYDEFYESQLWGTNIPEYLQKVYYSNSNSCIMFISKEYISKMWPTYERKNAIARQLEINDNYILLVRFDDTPVPGLDPLAFFEDAREKTAEEIANLFLDRFER